MTHLRSMSWVGLLATAALGAAAGCGEDDQVAGAQGTGPSSEIGRSLTYHRDARALFETKCAQCHQKGNIAPFALTSYDEVFAMRTQVAAAVASGVMPPWQPAAGCTDYASDFSLSEAERTTLLDWIEQGAPEGKVSDFVSPPHTEDSFVTDLELTLPEPYTPQRRPDDYRCFLVDWPETSSKFVTGLRVVPDRLDLVHHVIAFVARPEQVATFRAMDAAEPGAGYTCFGGPNSEGAKTMGRPFQLGGWAPGAAGGSYPQGTGIEVDPGSVLVLQVHYNSLTAQPGPDQSRLQLSLADKVEKPAMTFLALDPKWLQPGGMSIPAGESKVVHESTIDVTRLFAPLGGDRIGLSQGDAFVIHSVGMHMHELGHRGRTSVIRKDGSEQCLLQIDDWEFHWQGVYRLRETVHVNPGDLLRISCEWDNSRQNQSLLDGKPRVPQDVEWGEGTGDEMCLSPLFVTAS